MKLLIAALLGVLAGAATAGPPPVASSAARAWGFDRSDLAPHPAVRFGVLPNGLRYALMRNAAPAGALAVRMRIGAGAGVETASEQGYMHVLEHLVFQGSANLPPAALGLVLRQHGLRKDDEFSAVTGFDETVYRLDLPRADGRARQAALSVMREVATDLSFERKLVERARRSVRAELAGQDAVRERLIAAQDAFFLPGTAPARGPVGGSAGSIARASGTALRRLYARHYAPANATLVIVGDFDPDEAQREIGASFADWRGKAAAASHAPLPPPGLPPVRAERRARIGVFIDPAAATGVTIAAVEPPGGADAGGRRDAAFLEHLGAEMLGRRLGRAGGSSFIYDYFSAGRIARLDVAAPDRDWKRALATGATQLDRALKTGFTQAEFDLQLAAARTSLEGVKSAATSAALADAIVDAVNRRLVFTRPGDPDASLAYLTNVRLDAVNAAFRRMWSNGERMIFIAHNAPVGAVDRAKAPLPGR